MKKLTITQEAIDLIKHFEGFSKKPYKDIAGVCTIGYGTTYYPDGKHIKCSDEPINEQQAEEILWHMVKEQFYPCVLSLVNEEITTQTEFDALLSFTYNLGCGALKGSTLLRKHNSNDKKGASEEFKRWVHAGGKTINGLVKRREMEKQVYLA